MHDIQGPEEPFQDVSSRSTSCGGIHDADSAVPRVFAYSYKVPRRPFGSARLDSELKVRLVLLLH